MERDLDKKLYNDYLNGEKEAFELLYNKYKGRIEYFIYNIVKDYQKAEDLTQETFMYIMQNEIKENCSFKYFIYLIAKSKAFNYINVEIRRNEITELYLSNKDEQVEKDVLEVITKEETKNELLESIDFLDEKYKNAIYLVNIEGLSYAETSKILGETLQNTKSIIHRGKKQLKVILLKKGFDKMNKVAKVLLITILTGIILSGITYAANILIKHFFGQNSSDGVDKAVNEGYVADVKTEYQEADGIEVSIDSILMDDFNFNMNFNIKLSEKYDIENFVEVYLTDLKVVDETDKIVFETHKTQGQVLTQEELENTYNGAYSMLPTKISDNELKLSLSATGNPKLFPKSKKLYVNFTEIETCKYFDIKIIYTGNWHFEVDVPKEFYNRETTIYRVKECSEEGIDINQIQATLSKTGFRISIPEIKTDKVDYELLYTDSPKNIADKIALQKEYVETSDGKKFETAQRSDGDGGYSLPGEENKIINYHQTFNLTSYDATNELIVHIFTNNGKEITITFERS